VNEQDERPRDADTPKVGFKTSPTDFVVTELPAYEPTGAGDHVFVWFEKTNLTTDVAMRHLARARGANPRDAGVAGVKDRVAVSTQWGSFLLPKGDPQALLATLDVEGLRPLRITRHGHKLKPGHLRGNRFAVRLRSLDGDPLEPRLGPKLATAAKLGVPNAFGSQRFGREGDNAEQAARFVRGEAQPPRDKKRARFYFSALQSQLFNQLLSVRVEDGTFGTILGGDVAKKEENGALFDVPLEGPELEDAARRADALAVSPTGPMFGASRGPASRRRRGPAIDSSERGRGGRCVYSWSTCRFRRRVPISWSNSCSARANTRRPFYKPCANSSRSAPLAPRSPRGRTPTSTTIRRKVPIRRVVQRLYESAPDAKVGLDFVENRLQEEAAPRERRLIR
jgi:tRNA(Glu) U13 pseudouridine synthase TruD